MQGSKFARKCIAELRNQHSAVPSVTFRRFRRRKRLRSLTDLSDLRAFSSPACTAQWLADLDEYCNHIKRLAKYPNLQFLPSRRLEFFDAVFKSSAIPDNRICSGTFYCDGHCVIFPTVDLSRGDLGKTLKKKAQKAPGDDFPSGPWKGLPRWMTTLSDKTVILFHFRRRLDVDTRAHPQPCLPSLVKQVR